VAAESVSEATVSGMKVSAALYKASTASVSRQSSGVTWGRPSALRTLIGFENPLRFDTTVGKEVTKESSDVSGLGAREVLGTQDVLVRPGLRGGVAWQVGHGGSSPRS